MGTLKERLEFLERNLDERHIIESIERHKRSMHFEPVDRLPIQIEWGGSAPLGTLKEGFYNPEIMMGNELGMFIKSVLVPDDRIPAIRANHGVGTLPSLFGANVRYLEDNMPPWVDPLPGDAEDIIDRILDKGIPNLRSGLGARVLDTMTFYRETLSRYPKCNQLVKVYHPDLQGPFDVAHLILHTEIYYLMQDDPERLHSLLKLITNTYIQLMREIRKLCSDDLDGFSCHWGGLCGGYVAIRDDTPVNISRVQFEEFVKPYDEQILNAFDGGSIHYCGRADHWLPSMASMQGLRGLQFGNWGSMPNTVFGMPLLDMAMPIVSKYKVPIISYWLDLNEYDEFNFSRFNTGMTINVPASNEMNAKQILNDYMRRF